MDKEKVKKSSKIGGLVAFFSVIFCIMFLAGGVPMARQSKGRPTASAVVVFDEDGKKHTVDPWSVRGFQNMDGKTYVLYINGTVGQDILLDWSNMCRVIRAKYGNGASCHLGGRKK